MIFHVDMDAFYASVEIMDNPALKDRPVIVGGTGRRGVVAAASYAVRKFGVHSAMPMFMALQKCPQAIVIRPRRERYSEISREIMQVLDTFSPMVLKVSIDEAYLDMNASKLLFADTLSAVTAIKKAVWSKYPLTCSIGAAPVKFLAKVVSDINKPNGHFIVEEDAMAAFIAQLPVEKVPGVGRHSAQALHLLGVTRLGDLAKIPPGVVERRLGKNGLHLLDLALGRDARTLEPAQARKSLGSEHTLDENTADKELLKAYLLAQSREVGSAIRMRGLYFSTVTLKIKYGDFTIQTRRKTLPYAACATKAIYDAACELLDGKPLKQPLRLIGVTVSGFGHQKAEQLYLFKPAGGDDDNWSKVDDAVDAIEARFGKNAVTNAAVLKIRPPRNDET